MIRIHTLHSIHTHIYIYNIISYIYIIYTYIHTIYPYPVHSMAIPWPFHGRSRFSGTPRCRGSCPSRRAWRWRSIWWRTARPCGPMKSKPRRRPRRTGNCWELLGTAGNCWELLGTAGNCWELLGTAGNCWELLGTAGNCWVWYIYI